MYLIILLSLLQVGNYNYCNLSHIASMAICSQPAALVCLLQVFVAASSVMRTGQLTAAHCRACKYALNTLMNIFGGSALPAGLRYETLAGLVRVLLLRLVDDNLGRMSEGEALLKVRDHLLP